MNESVGEVEVFALHPATGELEWIGVQRLPGPDAFGLSAGMLLQTRDGASMWRIVTFGRVGGVADRTAVAGRDLIAVKRDRGEAPLRIDMRLEVCAI